MVDKIIKAIMNRYGALSTLNQAMYECTDTVLVNLSDDLDYALEETEILILIQKIIR
jgi:hypothetical protein